MSPEEPWKPTRDQLDAAEGTSISDVIASDLRVLFCGINPSLYSAAVGHHFARPGNRFWPVLHRAGFTDRELSPFEEDLLLDRDLGVTNLVRRATRAASDLDNEELVRGARGLRAKIGHWRPGFLAIVGIGAYRTAFARPEAETGEQPNPIGDTRVWVLPNPSGLNANYQMPELVELFSELRAAAYR